MAKRPRSSTELTDIEALVNLVENADELIDCLQSLQKWKPDIIRHSESAEKDPAFLKVKEDLSLLSSRLNPSISQLSTSQKAKNENASSQTKPSDVNQGATGGLPYPPPLLPPWKASDIPTSLPPLPKIYDREIERQVFTHPGVNRVSCAGSSNGLSYERLEWLGDAYLEAISSNLIYQTFKSLPAGRCSQLREQLVRNTNLAGYFRKYNLGNKAQIPSEVTATSQHSRGSSSDKDLIKVQADMFEAYVAATIITDPQNGVTTTCNWLRDIFSMTFKDEIIKQNSNRAEDPIEQEPKQRLAQIIVAKGISIRYEDIPSQKHQKQHKELKLPLFTIGAYLTGWGETHKLLGTGTALSKKEAGNKAARQALENKKLMKVYEQKKKEFVEAQMAQQ